MHPLMGTPGSSAGPGSLRGGPFVPGHFLTLIPAFLIDLMIGQETLGCQSPEPSREECWGNTAKIGRRVVARIVVWDQL